MDKGFIESEKMLNDLERRIHSEYQKAAKEVADKTTSYFNRFMAEDEKKYEQWKNGEITKKEYTEWRRRKMLTGKQYISMRDTLAKDLTNTDRIAMSYVNHALPDVYALNVNYETYSIEKDSEINTSFTLYNRDSVEKLIKDNPQLLPSPKVDVAKDYKWNQQHINSCIVQGILQGKSINKVAKDLQRVTGMDEKAAIRNARTAMTGAQNSGRLDSMKRAASRGVGLKKGWMATLDHVTRDSHVDLDGEVVDLDKPFSNGLMFPADGTGEPAEVYNCRCRLTHEYDKYRTDWSNLANRNTAKLGNMSYDEWKNKHKEKMVAKSVAASVAMNKDGKEIVFNFTISQSAIKRGQEAIERAEKTHKEAEELITNLSNEYNVYLTDVMSGRTGNGSEAGSVDAVGHMELASFKIDTVLHEFGHAFSSTNRVKWDLADENEKAFIKDAKKLFRQYKSEYQKSYVGGNMVLISNYSLENVDEFIAEGFTLAKGRELGFDLDKFLQHKKNEHKYSDEMLKLINKYFKRK